MISYAIGIYQKESSALVRYRTERFLKLVEVHQTAAHFERTHGRVVFVFHPAARAKPELEQRPANLRCRRKRRGDERRGSVELGERWKRGIVHAVSRSELQTLYPIDGVNIIPRRRTCWVLSSVVKQKFAAKEGPAILLRTSTSPH